MIDNLAVRARRGRNAYSGAHALGILGFALAGPAAIEATDLKIANLKLLDRWTRNRLWSVVGGHIPAEDF